MIESVYGPKPIFVAAAIMTLYRTPDVRLVRSRVGVLALTVTLLSTSQLAPPCMTTW